MSRRARTRAGATNAKRICLNDRAGQDCDEEESPVISEEELGALLHGLEDHDHQHESRRGHGAP